MSNLKKNLPFKYSKLWKHIFKNGNNLDQNKCRKLIPASNDNSRDVFRTMSNTFDEEQLIVQSH